MGEGGALHPAASPRRYMAVVHPTLYLLGYRVCALDSSV
jgi:hypothetical protein